MRLLISGAPTVQRQNKLSETIAGYCGRNSISVQAIPGMFYTSTLKQKRDIFEGYDEIFGYDSGF